LRKDAQKEGGDREGADGGKLRRDECDNETRKKKSKGLRQTLSTFL
jgi:hypothetical protein